ncbi:hypothetical protein DFH09DRAFT_1087088 [Mycena vulgaris]|nr:hypothetical protein DFH09DRAFT_1087088 [Mycena vulgaris]
MAKQKSGGSPRVTGKRKAELPEPESESEGSVAGSVDSRATTTRGTPGSHRSMRTATSGAPSASSTPSKPKPKPRKRPNTGAAAEPGTPAASPSTPKVGPPHGLKRTDALPSIPGASSSSNPAAPPAASKKAIPSDRDAFPPSFVLQGANDGAINFEIDVVPGTVTARLVRGHRSNEELEEFYAASIDSSKTNRAIPVADFASDWHSSEMGMIVDGAPEADSAAAAYNAVCFRLECLEEFLALYLVVNPYSTQPLSFDDPSFDDANDPKPARVASLYNPPVPKLDPARSDADVSADTENFQVEASEYVAWWSAEGARLERTFLADLAAWTARRQAWVDHTTKHISLRAEQVHTYIDRRNFTISRHLSIIQSLGEYGYILSVGPEHFFSERTPHRLPPSSLPADFSQPSAAPASSSLLDRRLLQRILARLVVLTAQPDPVGPYLDPEDEQESDGQFSGDKFDGSTPVDKGKGRELGAGGDEGGESELEVVPSSVLGEEELPPRTTRGGSSKKAKKSKAKREFFGEGTPSAISHGLYTADNAPCGLSPFNGGGYTLSTLPGLEHCIAGFEDAGLSPSMVGPLCMLRVESASKGVHPADGYNFQVVGLVYTQVLDPEHLRVDALCSPSSLPLRSPLGRQGEARTVPLVLDGTPEEVSEVVKTEALEVLPAVLLGIERMGPAGSSQDSLRAVFAGYARHPWIVLRGSEPRRACVAPGTGSTGMDGDGDVMMVGGRGSLPSRIRFANQLGSLGQMPRLPAQLSHGFGVSAAVGWRVAGAQVRSSRAPRWFRSIGIAASQAPPSTSRAPKSSGPKPSAPPP